ncbi:MAG TPA: hypothetical protein PLH57_06105 [Oligoflexia bacterium]|nr:hypothetical protein [Oligoflexia bacterium]
MDHRLEAVQDATRYSDGLYLKLQAKGNSKEPVRDEEADRMAMRESVRALLSEETRQLTELYDRLRALNVEAVESELLEKFVQQRRRLEPVYEYVRFKNGGPVSLPLPADKEIPRITLRELVDIKVTLQTLLLQSHKLNRELDESRFVMRRDAGSESAMFRTSAAVLLTGAAALIGDLPAWAIAPAAFTGGAFTLFAPRAAGKVSESRLPMKLILLTRKELVDELGNLTKLMSEHFKFHPVHWISQINGNVCKEFLNPETAKLEVPGSSPWDAMPSIVE